MEADIGHLWSHFDRLQGLSRLTTQCGAREYAIEAALAYLTEAAATGCVSADPRELEADLERVGATAMRRYRHRARALRMRIPDDAASTEEVGDAHIELERIGSILAKDDAVILLEAGMGFTDREIAQRRGVTPNAVRVRLHRLRKKLSA